MRVEPLEDRRLLATLTVTNNLDTLVNGSGDGISLREAVLSAASGDTINFAASLTSGGTTTIALSNLGQIAINKSLTIQGPGSHLLTIKAFDPDANGANDGDGARIFYINQTVGLANVTISGVTLTNGDVANSGGAIANNENLTIRDAVIRDNAAVHASARGGGIAHFFGTLTIERTTISDNFATITGGGVLADHATQVNVTESTVSGNQAAAGGGVYGFYSYNMNLVSSTISGNSARFSGGGVGLFYGTLSAHQSTITANRADSDGNGSGAGGGVHVSPWSSLSLFHTIVAGNFRSVGGASARSDIFGPVSAQFSLIGDNSQAIVTNVGGTSIVGTGAMPRNPLLGPLAPNGGTTYTHALLAGSPAIDSGQAGIPSPPANDQRGAPFLRIFDDDGVGGARIDMGAYERQTLPGVGATLVVDQILDENDGNFSLGDLSLREAISLANSHPGAHTVTFASSLFSGGPATIRLTRGELVIVEGLTISGPGANLITVDASGSDPTSAVNNGDGSRLLRIDDGTAALINVTIAGLTLTGGDVSGQGGGILGRENLSVIDSVVSGNAAGLHGGGIHNSNGVLTILRSKISGNHAFFDGGGIVGVDGSTFVTDSTVSGNSTDEGGGGIQSYDGDLTVTGSTISGNTADLLGGGIYSVGGALTISRSTISNNSAIDGGGIVSFSTTTITDTTIAGNTATFGGGISHNSANLTITGSTISGNSATNQGGGLFSELGPLLKTLIVNSTFSDNTAAVEGSSIFVDEGDVEIRHSTIAMDPFVPNPGGSVTARSSTDVDVYSSIIADSGGLGDVVYLGMFNPFTSLGYNLIGGGNAAGDFNQPTDILGQAWLGDLADNGGWTKTIFLREESPAIDAGPAANAPGLPLSDQRGFPFIRAYDADGINGIQLDIGAYEIQTVPNLTLVVDTLDDVYDGDFSAGQLSIREAMWLANGSIGLDPINFAASLTSGGPATISLAHGELAVRDPVTLNGPGAALLAIDASASDPTPAINNGDGSRIFASDNNASGGMSIVFTINGLTLTGADYADRGGAIWSRKTVILNDSVVSGNSARNGGGVYIDSGFATLNNSTILGNHAREDGGGLMIEDGRVFINSSVIKGNSAVENGGGLNNLERMSITSSTISGNTAAIGGGIYARSSIASSHYLNIVNSTISGNTATNRGGGLYSYGDTTVRFSTITSNTAPTGFGSGVASRGDASTATKVYSTIIAGNANTDVDYVNGVANYFDSEGYNVIGDGNAILSPFNAFNQSGDHINANPMLASLANNGGPTMTHALLPGSVAIDGGNPAVTAPGGIVPTNDQRGIPFNRIVHNVPGGAAIDVGAYELQTVPASVFGDYNRDGGTDAADYVMWRKTLGTTGLPMYAGADGSGNTSVGTEDRAVWVKYFGSNLGGSGSGGQEVSTGGVVAVDRVADAKIAPLAALDGTGSLDAPGPIVDLARGSEWESFGQSAVRGQETRAQRAQLESRARHDDGLLAWLSASDSVGGEDDGSEFDVGRSTEESDAIDESIDKFFAALAGV